MRAVFRFDASPELGAGHAHRCLTLARALSGLGWSCHALTNREAAATVPALRENPDLSLTDSEDFVPQATDWLIVDHYGLDADWEAGCRRWASAILAIDDLADRPHDCDLLLDQTFGRRGDDYAGLLPAHCRVLAGSGYALLRPAFAAARPASLARRAGAGGLRRIVVSFGATDPQNYTSAALDGIAGGDPALTVDVVLSSAAPHLAAVRRKLADLPQQARLHVDIADMEDLLSAADLAVGAAGTSTWERCCLGLPSLLAVIADNQRLVAESVVAAGAARMLPGPKDALPAQIAEALGVLAEDSQALQDMSGRATAICDGRGCDRLGLALATPGRAKDGRSVALRLATPDDEEALLAWQSHPTTRRFSRNPAVPTAAEHHAWFTARLADPDCLLTIITLEGKAAGMLRLDPPAAPESASGPSTREISILVDPARRGLGIALEALDFARRWQAATVIAATILPGNDASAALFRAAGYHPGADGRLYSSPPQTVPGRGRENRILKGAAAT